MLTFEILARERSKPGINGLLQWAAVVIGFSAMMCVELFGKMILQKKAKVIG